MGYNLSRIWSWLRNQIVGYYKWKKGDNMNILKLQKCFIWLLFFNNLQNSAWFYVIWNLEMAPDRTILHLLKKKSHTSISLSRIMACTLLNLTYAPAELTSAIVGYYKWKKGDNMNILKLQKCFIWLLFYKNLRKGTSHIFFENFWMKMEAHLISNQSYRTRLLWTCTKEWRCSYLLRHEGQILDNFKKFLSIKVIKIVLLWVFTGDPLQVLLQVFTGDWLQ
jgi:hypothetical protein